MTTSIPYTVFWSDGTRTVQRKGLLTIDATEVSIGAFLLEHPISTGAATLVVILIVSWAYGRRPRTLRGRLLILYKGKKEVDLDLPRDLKAKRLLIEEVTGPTKWHGGVVQVGTGAQRKLAWITMKRIKGRWQMCLLPQGDSLTTEKGIVRAERVLNSGEQIRTLDSDIKFTVY